MNGVRVRAAGVLLACVLALPTGCGESTSQPPTANVNDRFTIYTTFYPMAYFAEQVAGDLADVVCPLPEGEDPIFWLPSRATIADFQHAGLIVINGAEFEKWIATASLPISRVVDSAAPLADRFLTFEEMAHNHGLKGEHSHAGVDGHTWVDPVSARVQAGEILKAMVKRLPQHEAALRANHAALIADLERLDDRMQSLAPRLAQTTLLASHPAYNYLASRYELAIANLDIDPDGSVDQLSQLTSVIEANPPGDQPRDHAGILLWESSPSAALAEATAALGLANVVFSPGESLAQVDREDGVTYISNMNANLDRLEAALAN